MPSTIARNTRHNSQITVDMIPPGVKIKISSTEPVDLYLFSKQLGITVKMYVACKNREGIEGQEPGSKKRFVPVHSKQNIQLCSVKKPVNSYRKCFGISITIYL
jgi:hypothetical protein